MSPRRIAALALLAVAGGTLGGAPATGTQASSEALAQTLEGCRPLVVGKRTARGGCDLRTRPERMALTVLSMFGDQSLGHCLVHYRARLGADRRIALTGVTFDRRGSQSASCGDFMACTADPSRSRETDTPLPWYGRVEGGADGTATARFELCFDSCFGRFEGPLSFELRRSGGRTWRLRADHAAVGVSGLEISTDWELGRR